uniref:Lipase_3 domain-containing protein n=1 Tax=Steinernema glaseri TaxID=37863 RepID=A0A1I7Z1E2_9BILA
MLEGPLHWRSPKRTKHLHESTNVLLSLKHAPADKNDRSFASSNPLAHPPPITAPPAPLLGAEHVPTLHARCIAWGPRVHHATLVPCGSKLKHFSAMRSTSVLLVAAALLGVVLSTAIRKQRMDLAGYDDSFARYKMLSFSAMAYADEPNLCMKSAYPAGGNNTVHKRVEVPCDSDDSSCRGMSAVSHSDKAIILTFRGTNQFLQLIQEAVNTVFDPEPFIAGGYVSRYFYEAFKSVWRGGLKDDFLALRNKYPDYEVWVTGHSLGGAMASLCAATLAHLGQVNTQKLRLMTFGQPRVGDKAFATAHDAMILFAYRVVHNRDIVPHVPPEILPDHGLIDGYVHHKSEVWYPNKMRVDDSYVICNADEGKKCSDSDYITLSVSDHLSYFEDHEWITDFGEDGCPVQMVNK